jgi:hypothetical protein
VRELELHKLRGGWDRRGRLLDSLLLNFTDSMDFIGDGVVASKGNNSHDHAIVFRKRLIPNITTFSGIDFLTSLGY